MPDILSSDDRGGSPMNTAQTEARYPSDRQPSIRTIMMPPDTNSSSTIFGGVILSHIDMACSPPRVPLNCACLPIIRVLLTM